MRQKGFPCRCSGSGWFGCAIWQEGGCQLSGRIKIVKSAARALRSPGEVAQSWAAYPLSTGLRLQLRRVWIGLLRTCCLLRDALGMPSMTSPELCRVVSYRRFKVEVRGWKVRCRDFRKEKKRGHRRRFWTGGPEMVISETSHSRVWRRPQPTAAPRARSATRPAPVRSLWSRSQGPAGPQCLQFAGLESGFPPRHREKPTDRSWEGIGKRGRGRRGNPGRKMRAQSDF